MQQSHACIEADGGATRCKSRKEAFVLHDLLPRIPRVASKHGRTSDKAIVDNVRPDWHSQLVMKNGTDSVKPHARAIQIEAVREAICGVVACGHQAKRGVVQQVCNESAELSAPMELHVIVHNHHELS